MEVFLMKNKLLVGALLAFGCVPFASANLVIKNNDIEEVHVRAIGKGNKVLGKNTFKHGDREIIPSNSTAIVKTIIFNFDVDPALVIRNISYDMRAVDVLIILTRVGGSYTAMITDRATGQMTFASGQAELYSSEDV